MAKLIIAWTASVFNALSWFFFAFRRCCCYTYRESFTEGNAQDTQQRAAAKEFVARWKGRGDEKQETQSFWIDLLSNVTGVSEPTSFINFEVPVKLSHTSFIDGLIPSTRVLIEQKGMDINLDKSQKQSDGSMLTPFGQARRYAGYLPHNENPRWIVVCNFQEFRIHDMNRPNDEPETVLLSDLEKEYGRLGFLTDTGDEHIKKELEVSIQAIDNTACEGYILADLEDLDSLLRFLRVSSLSGSAYCLWKAS